MSEPLMQTQPRNGTINILPVAIPDETTPLPGWRRTLEDACAEWIRDDNRVCMRQSGPPREDGTPGWTVWLRAEQSANWDTDPGAPLPVDGLWPAPTGETFATRENAAWWVGMMFAPLAVPLSVPSWAPVTP